MLPLTAAAIPCSTYADDEMIIEIIPETADTIVTVKPEKDKTKISPYIFGINDKGNIAGISPTVIKQTGTSLSTGRQISQIPEQAAITQTIYRW